MSIGYGLGNLVTLYDIDDLDVMSKDFNNNKRLFVSLDSSTYGELYLLNKDANCNYKSISIYSQDSNLFR